MNYSALYGNNATCLAFFIAAVISLCCLAVAPVTLLDKILPPSFAKTNKNGVFENTEFLEKFLRNLLLGEKNILKNRDLHI